MANAWNQVGTLKGPQGQRGEKGEKGDAGAAGKSVRLASIDVGSNTDVAFTALSPATNVAVGDTVIDAKGEMYTVESVTAESAHVGDVLKDASGAPITVRGPQGERGEQGQKGEDGTSITVKGSVATSADLPADAAVGDTYVTASDGHMWVKTAATGDDRWTDLGEMKGPKGDKGDKGDQGDPGAKGDKGDPGQPGPGIGFGQAAPTGSGQVGQVYIDTTDWAVYQYGEAAQA